MSLQDLNGKDVFLWGLGREGLSLLRCLEENRIAPKTLRIYTDDPLSEEERARVSQSFPSLAPHVLSEAGALESSLASSQILVKSPGVSLYRKEIQVAKANGIRSLSTTTLWFQELRIRDPKAKIVVVTGTKGKSTTSSLLAHLLRGMGRSALLGGNIGTPVLDLLREEVLPEFWILELSSYQVMDAELQADIILLLNLYPEHVDWHGTVEQYYQDKLSILKAANDSTRVLVNAESPRLMQTEVSRGRRIVFNEVAGIHEQNGFFFDGERELFSTTQSKLLGPQNISNVCAALAVLREARIDPKQAETALSTFSSLPHRLAFVAEKGGVSFINDSISTVPQSALAAYRAFSGRWITSLLGGYERAQDWDELARGILAAKVNAVITLPDSGNKIANALGKLQSQAAHFPTVLNTESLSEAVHAAARITPRDGIVLLSPAAPSYGHFKNFEERGREFERLVRELPGE